MNKAFLKAQGARILSELNDLKRTADACAAELNWDREEVARVLSGDVTPDRMMAFIDQVTTFYPIDRAELMLMEDDCSQGIRMMRAQQSRDSARVFARRNRNGEKTPYYEYRDTAMSRLSAFRPEWIQELRYVQDNDPNNADVAYNNGHFMHQVTFFVGPVNFYYDIDGEKRCVEMNTGDSNYITPYRPHSFTTRSETELAYIIAVTFGGDVKRALGELYRYGKNRSSGYLFNVRNPEQGTQDLLDFHLKNELMTRELLQERLKVHGAAIDVLDRSKVLSPGELEAVAEALNIEASDLMLPAWRSDEEVVVKHHADEKGYLYPGRDNARYHVYPTARCHRMPQVKSFNIKILSGSGPSEPDLSSALHTYIYNYSQSPVRFAWRFEGRMYEETLNPDDSVYVQPFIPYQFKNESGGEAWVFTVGIPGALHSVAQRELSAFADFDRVIEENKCWFNA